MLIAQLSDLHVGGGRYREELLRTAISEINALQPDLVVVAGDLTDDGYPDQYPVVKEEVAAIECPHVVVVPVHGSRPLPRGTLAKIIRIAGIGKRAFFAAIR